MRRALIVCCGLAALVAAPAASAAVAPVRWCGNDRAQNDRIRDRAGGSQVHVIYAIPADGEDRFDALASALATDVAAIDAWWRGQDPERAPRWDLFEFPGCDSRFGMLDLSFARLSEPAAALAGSDRFEQIASRLAAPPFLFDAFHKKYLVFYDGPVDPDHNCGTASGRPDVGGRFSYAVIYLRSTCPTTLGTGRGNAYIAAHEMLHMLGALDRATPNECAGDEGHVCDSSLDILYPFYSMDSLDHAILDVGRNDYYAHGAPWFDVRTSRWLLNPLAQVSLTVRVVGRGVVGSEPDGQGCTAVCVIEWDAGTPVQLAVAAGAGFRFVGWGGACVRERTGSCLVDVTAPTEVVARFRRLVRMTLAVSGRGAITGTRIRCVRSCGIQRLEGERIALRARPAGGWRFVRWTGRCRGTRVTCTVRAAAAGRVGAVFARR